MPTPDNARGYKTRLDNMKEEKSKAVEILKDYFKALAEAYIKQLKMIEEYNKLRAKQNAKKRGLIK